AGDAFFVLASADALHAAVVDGDDLAALVLQYDVVHVHVDTRGLSSRRGHEAVLERSRAGEIDDDARVVVACRRMNAANRDGGASLARDEHGTKKGCCGSDSGVHFRPL